MSDRYSWIEGIPVLSDIVSPELLSEEWKRFVFKEDDILILTYPKSGMNWLIEIISLISTKGDPKWIQSVPIWDRAFWLELKHGYGELKHRKSPCTIACHLPIQLMPKSLFTSKAKVIYAIRNPRDVLISGYFFWKVVTFAKKADSLEQYFEWFLQGEVPYGSWFEHTRGWMAMREKENFLLLSYEELRKDTRNTIEKICRFLGKNLEPKEKDSVLKHSSFQVMKDNKMSNYELLDGSSYNTKNGAFHRKGICGDWRNHFTRAQAEAFDRTFQEKMAGIPPDLFPWD